MKKGMLSALALAALVTGLLVGVSPSPRRAARPTSTTSPAGSRAKRNPPTSARSTARRAPSSKACKADVKYTVCVKFPKKEHLCTEKPQEAEKGTLYVNKITSTSVGRHQVTWFVKGKKVGTTVFRVE